MHKVNKLYQLLENSAVQFPDQTALVHLEERCSYKELNDAANQIQQHLKNNSIGEGDRVVLCCPKSIISVACIFGILKSGAAYLPVDFSSPIERNQYIFLDAEALAIILTKTYFENFKNDFCFVAELGESLVLAKTKKKEIRRSPEDLAYILYTSGSTGRPKGVMCSHEGALEFIDWSSDVFKPNSSDCFSSHAPFHFDLSVFDLFVSIKHAARLVLIKEETAKQPLLLAQLIAEQKVTIWYSTPSILIMLSEFGKIEKYNFEHLKRILFAGEVFPVNKFKGLKNKIPQAVYYNLYGPTETNVCTYFKLPENIETTIPIGKVCEHYESLVVEEELMISGKGVMLGYWKGIKKDPFMKEMPSGKIWYKTGDLVERDADNNYIFKGRRDRMVKRNGYRIELDEIEIVLSKHPEMIVNAVVASNNTEEQTIITAFVVLRKGGEKSTIKWKEYCMNHLPSYMVPNDIRFVEELPYTSSDKVDYQKLKQSV